MSAISEALEAAAEGFYMSGPGGTEKHWDDLTPSMQSHFRRRARIALEAAAPHIWDAGQDAGANDQMAVDASLANGTPEPRQTLNPYRRGERIALLVSHGLPLLDAETAMDSYERTPSSEPLGADAIRVATILRIPK